MNILTTICLLYIAFFLGVFGAFATGATVPVLGYICLFISFTIFVCIFWQAVEQTMNNHQKD